MRIGTRGSDLALWQARFVRALLLEETGVEPELVIIKTAGDKDHSVSLAAMAGKGFFTKEIEDALMDAQIDCAVHSLKDLQTEMPEGLALCAMPVRADRRDVILIRPEAVDTQKKLHVQAGASIGTSSSRRMAQLSFLRPDLKLEDLRGNVPTRVRKLREGQYDAILLAAAGLDRLELELEDLYVYRLPEMLFVPAPGQGTLGLQIRAGDTRTQEVIGKLDQPSLRRVVGMEREVLRRLEGGCQLALGTAAGESKGRFRLLVFLGTADPAAPRRVLVGGLDSAPILDAAESYLRGQTRPTNGSRAVRVWVTREPDRARAFVRSLSGGHFDVFTVPTFAAVPAGSADDHKRAAANIATYDWVFLTSQTAVVRFAEILEEHEAKIPEHTHLAAVGQKTARAITERGWHADFVSDVADARSFGEAFLAKAGNHIGRVLFPCGVAASDVLKSDLADGCEAFDRLDCYDTVEHPELIETLSPLPDPDAVVFTSPRAARFLLERRNISRETVAVAIGPATTDALLDAGFPLVYEAPERSLEGTAEVINGLFVPPSTPPLAS